MARSGDEFLPPFSGQEDGPSSTQKPCASSDKDIYGADPAMGGRPSGSSDGACAASLTSHPSSPTRSAARADPELALTAVPLPGTAAPTGAAGRDLLTAVGLTELQERKHSRGGQSSDGRTNEPAYLDLGDAGGLGSGADVPAAEALRRLLPEPQQQWQRTWVGGSHEPTEELLESHWRAQQEQKLQQQEGRYCFNEQVVGNMPFAERYQQHLGHEQQQLEEELEAQEQLAQLQLLLVQSARQRHQAAAFETMPHGLLPRRLQEQGTQREAHRFLMRNHTALQAQQRDLVLGEVAAAGLDRFAAEAAGLDRFAAAAGLDRFAAAAGLDRFAVAAGLDRFAAAAGLDRFAAAAGLDRFAAAAGLDRFAAAAAGLDRFAAAAAGQDRFAAAAGQDNFAAVAGLDRFATAAGQGKFAADASQDRFAAAAAGQDRFAAAAGQNNFAAAAGQDRFSAAAVQDRFAAAAGQDCFAAAVGGLDRFASAAAGQDRVATAAAGQDRFATAAAGQDLVTATVTGQDRFAATAAGLDRFAAAAGQDRFAAAVAGLDRFAAAAAGQDRVATAAAGLDRFATAAAGQERVDAAAAGQDRFAAAAAGQDRFAAAAGLDRFAAAAGLDRFAAAAGLDRFAAAAGLDRFAAAAGLDRFAAAAGLDRFAAAAGLDNFAVAAGLDRFAAAAGLDRFVAAAGLDRFAAAAGLDNFAVAAGLDRFAAAAAGQDRVATAAAGLDRFATAAAGQDRVAAAPAGLDNLAAAAPGQDPFAGCADWRTQGNGDRGRGAYTDLQQGAWSDPASQMYEPQMRPTGRPLPHVASGLPDPAAAAAAALGCAASQQHVAVPLGHMEALSPLAAAVAAANTAGPGISALNPLAAFANSGLDVLQQLNALIGCINVDWLLGGQAAAAAMAMSVPQAASGEVARLAGGLFQGMGRHWEPQLAQAQDRGLTAGTSDADMLEAMNLMPRSETSYDRKAAAPNASVRVGAKRRSQDRDTERVVAAKFNSWPGRPDNPGNAADFHSMLLPQPMYDRGEELPGVCGSRASARLAESGAAERAAALAASQRRYDGGAMEGDNGRGRRAMRRGLQVGALEQGSDVAGRKLEPHPRQQQFQMPQHPEQQQQLEEPQGVKESVDAESSLGDVALALLSFSKQRPRSRLQGRGGLPDGCMPGYGKPGKAGTRG